jgi:hypothetical protein
MKYWHLQGPQTCRDVLLCVRRRCRPGTIRTYRLAPSFKVCAAQENWLRFSIFDFRLVVPCPLSPVP